MLRTDGTDLTGFSAFEVAKILQRREGSSTILGEKRYNAMKSLGRFELIKKYKIKSPVFHRMVRLPVDKKRRDGDGKFANVGYVQPEQLNVFCQLGVQYALESLEGDHPDGYVLDPR